ncbi:hypothetical protein FACS1894151_08860 [Spirochaetia bacterium]|nr:hypothetical protein FACS1894151_08860 [Spirochaetia bacterium]
MKYSPRKYSLKSKSNLPYLLSLLLLTLLCVFTAPVNADVIENISGTGIYVRSIPSGARVFIDGVERGMTPLRLTDLPGGRYSIRLLKEGYIMRRIIVSVPGEEAPGDKGCLSVLLDLEQARGRVDLHIRGEGEAGVPLKPLITVDGNPVFDTLLELPVGFRTIRIRSFGWEEMTQTIYVQENSVLWLSFVLKPAAFRLTNFQTQRRRINPANSGSLGTTDISFNVSAPGFAELTIRDSSGSNVFTRRLGPFDTWNQAVTWNGRGANGKPLPEGDYTVKIRSTGNDTSGTEAGYETELTVTIDSSIEIFPLSLSAGSGGLLFTPMPQTLPASSFQIEGNLLFGSPFQKTAWSSLPFSAAFRISPVNALEAAGTFSVGTTLNENEAHTAFGASLKWEITGARNVFGAALGLAYAWAQNGAFDSFGMDSGIKLFAPFSLQTGGTTFVLSPAILWTGDEGYPASPLPRFLLNAAAVFRLSMLVAGFSVRTEYRIAPLDRSIKNDSAWFGPLISGVEIKFFPPPSNFILSIQGGYWLDSTAQGFFGGAGIGIIY